jgi:heme ABC exporter ATP-binding subunit CcmA
VSDGDPSVGGDASRAEAGSGGSGPGTESGTGASGAPAIAASATGTGSGTVVALAGAISLIDRFPALAGLDLTVDEGEILLLRGPNGAGKTTLLRLCAGLAPLNDGTGTVLGHDLTDRTQRRALRRHTGLLAHSTFLYDDLTVEENLVFWAKANRIDTASVEPVLDRLALGDRLRGVKVSSLSAGQRRRTSLAVLVVRRPRLWLLDEPHAGLDANGRDFVDGLIRHAVAFGATVMFASHDVDRALDIASRTAMVVGGQVVDDGRSAPEADDGSGTGYAHGAADVAGAVGQEGVDGVA